MPDPALPILAPEAAAASAVDAVPSAGPPAPAPARGGKFVNPWRALPRVRWAVQLAYVAFLSLVGWQFVRFFEAARGTGPIAVARPPAVEAFLPIAALMAAKRLVLTGAWDEIHPAGLVVLLAAISAAFLARKAFCSWVCPVGTLSRALEWLGQRTLWRRGWPAVPRALDLPLSAVKYLLLAFFAWAVARMPLEGIVAFQRAPYNLAADAKMLLFFRELSATGLAVLGALAALSLA